MDIILTFAEKGKLLFCPAFSFFFINTNSSFSIESIIHYSIDYADQNLPLSCLSGLLDLQTIAGCHHIFDYIESRRERLTKVNYTFDVISFLFSISNYIVSFVIVEYESTTRKRSTIT